MDCKTFRTQVADLFDKDVSPREKAELQRHMDECEACRNYYHELAQTAEMLRPRHSPLQHLQKPEVSRNWIKAAAAFAGVILAAGITVAAIHHAQNRPAQPPQAKSTPVNFTNISLDSILSVVAPHYRKTVVFRDEAPRQMQLIMTWNPTTPFDDFVRRLNAFDGLLLTVQQDTLFVEAKSEDEK
ncbi:MAG: zf-HC2 domain-containing protein [Bacteroidaceae bacterium]|nr:zf-HC2 domain-containing protein [Bacteroidaceae bacterium]